MSFKVHLIKLSGRKARQFGFTLIELITVMIVIGILGAIAAPRFFDRKGFDAVAYSDQIRALIRYGQKIAIAENRNVFVRIDGNSVALCFDSTCTSYVLPASRNNSGSSTTLARCGNTTAWACEGLPNGLTMSPSTTITFYFDPTGKPFASGDTPPTLASSFANDMVITIGGDGTTHTTTVTAETGYVY
ncbi:MAG: prepilin-type N-terminal cleavage/methylation domain-containing protein [Pseudomonadota bacterium]